ncbi:hypothetical protein BGX31_007824 [Mortierella sp. GBA43]|nr:hypothetical protein BGX31_007824 [Mortierella sp. GBA43]
MHVHATSEALVQRLNGLRELMIERKNELFCALTPAQAQSQLQARQNPHQAKTSTVPLTNHPNIGPEPTKPRDMGEMSKQSLTNAMQREHPIRTLSIGTLNANLKRVLSERPSLRNTAKFCIQDVVRQASITKRTCQRAIALYIERLSSSGMDETDRKILDKLCARVSNDTVASDENLNAVKETQNHGNEDADENEQIRFIFSLLVAIYNRRPPKD